MIECGAMPRKEEIMRLVFSVMLGMLLAAASGCATGKAASLQRKNAALESQLAAEKAAAEKLQQQLAALKKINSTLQKEKGVRVEETAAVRSQIRSFVQLQVESLRDFSQNAELFDSVGGELIARDKTGGENLLLVDMQNALLGGATLIGGRLYGSSGTRAVFCLLRPQDNKLAVVWMSKVFNIPAEGVFKVSFDTPVTAKKDDVIGIYCPAKVGIPYDIGTGDTRTMTGPVDPGMVIPMDSLQGGQKRAYSFGVNGFFD